MDKIFVLLGEASLYSKQKMELNLGKKYSYYEDWKLVQVAVEKALEVAAKVYSKDPGEE